MGAVAFARRNGRVGGLVGRTAFNVARERITRPRPRTLDEVPPSPDALTAEWLTDALCHGHADAAVAGFELGPIDSGTSARRKVRVSYNQAGVDAGLPTHLFTKSSPTLLTRLVTSMANLLPAEHAFYHEIRDMLDIEAPAALYAAWDPANDRSLFVMDDVTVTRGAKVDTVLTRQATRAHAESIVDLLAALHARFWMQPGLQRRWPWLLTPAQWQHRLDELMGFDKKALAGIDRASEVLPAGIVARRSRYPDALNRCREVSGAGPRTLLHTDVHAGNWYTTADDRMGLFDWQCMLLGHGIQDVSYALIGNLTIENRRAWERDLLERYLHRLGELGAEDVPGWDEAWLCYRQMVPHAMFMWLGTIGSGRLQPKMQPDEISLANLERSGQAAEDLESYEALGV